MKSAKDNNPVEIFSGNIMEAEMLKNVLEDNGIEAFLKDEFTGSLAPWYTSPGGLGSVKVVVSDLNVEQAQLLVTEFGKNYSK